MKIWKKIKNPDLPTGGQETIFYLRVAWSDSPRRSQRAVSPRRAPSLTWCGPGPGHGPPPRTGTQWPRADHCKGRHDMFKVRSGHTKKNLFPV